MKTPTNMKRLDILGNSGGSLDRETLASFLKQLGYCSLFAAVPTMLASHTSEARSDEAKKPEEASVALRTAKRLDRLNKSCSNPALLKRQSAFLLPHQQGTFDPLAPLGGTDDCPGRAIPGGNYTAAAPFIDSGNTTGANDTITHVYYYYYYNFDAHGPDHIYSFTLTGRGPNPRIQVSTTSANYIPVIYILETNAFDLCPAGTGNSGLGVVSAAAPAGGTATLDSFQINYLPLNIPLHLVIDSFRNDASGSGAYTVRMQDVTIAPAPLANPIDDTQFFVRQHYLDFLNRDPDAAGLSFWTNEINLCGTDAGCIAVKRVNVSAAYFLSVEFQETGYFVYRANMASYGNLPGKPVPVIFSEFLPDTQGLGQGVVVNQSGWELALENNKQSYTSNFVQRSRFVSAFPTFLSPTQFVDLLFANAGVTPSTDDRAAAIAEFGSSSTSADIGARSRALRRVIENTALKQQEYNRAFVLMQYFGYLRRNPNDAPEPGFNFNGYNFWLNKLNQFNGNYVTAEMVKAFITSSEYRQRFGSP